MAQTITRLNPPTLPDAGRVGYSQISIVDPGRMAYVSGQVAWTRDGGPVPGGLAAQMTVVTTNARAALAAIGATPSDVVLVRLYVVDLTPDRLGQVMPGFLALFDGVQPSVTGVGVAALAAPELQVEMEMVVRLPD